MTVRTPCQDDPHKWDPLPDPDEPKQPALVTSLRRVRKAIELCLTPCPMLGFCRAPEGVYGVINGKWVPEDTVASRELARRLEGK